MKEIKLKRQTHGTRVNGKRCSEYIAWDKMIQRCSNPNNPSYEHYGGRGITVCQEWTGRNGFSNFMSDMGEKPSKGHSLDRYPDNNGNYGKMNCRWATIIEQQNNRRDNVFITFQNKKQTMSQWSRELGISVSCIADRMKLGLPTCMVLYKPPKAEKPGQKK